MTCTKLWINFFHRRTRDTIVILEEGSHPHRYYLYCDMCVPWAEINHHQPKIALYVQGDNRKIHHQTEELAQAGAAMELQVYGKSLESVTTFK